MGWSAFNHTDSQNPATYFDPVREIYQSMVESPHKGPVTVRFHVITSYVCFIPGGTMFPPTSAASAYSGLYPYGQASQHAQMVLAAQQQAHHAAQVQAAAQMQSPTIPLGHTPSMPALPGLSAAGAGTQLVPHGMTHLGLHQPRPATTASAAQYGPYGHQPILYWYPSPPVSPQSAYYVQSCPSTVVMKGLPVTAQVAEIMQFFEGIYEVRKSNLFDKSILKLHGLYTLYGLLNDERTLEVTQPIHWNLTTAKLDSDHQKHYFLYGFFLHVLDFWLEIVERIHEMFSEIACSRFRYKPSEKLQIDAKRFPSMGRLPDMQNYGLRMCRECWEPFPQHCRLAIPTCITARASRTCHDACRDR